MIKEYRERKKYTQKEMAEILEISERQYQRIDKEKSMPRKETLLKIFKLLQIPEDLQKNYIYEMWKKEWFNMGILLFLVIIFAIALIFGFISSKIN